MGAQRVLLVEDDALSLKLMRDALRAHGYEIEELGDGAEAVARAAQLRLDLIVMDIGLPGLDGVEATRRLKATAATRHIPVVAVTAYAMPNDELRMRRAGCDAFLTKPVRLAELASVVRSLLAKSASPGD